MTTSKMLNGTHSACMPQRATKPFGLRDWVGMVCGQKTPTFLTNASRQSSDTFDSNSKEFVAPLMTSKRNDNFLPSKPSRVGLQIINAFRPSLAMAARIPIVRLQVKEPRHVQHIVFCQKVPLTTSRNQPKTQN